MIRFKRNRGGTIRHGDCRLTPVARSLSARFPLVSGGLVWSRPGGVVIERDGEERLIPIPDLTRRWQWFFLGAGAAVAMIIRLARRPAGRRLLRR